MFPYRRGNKKRGKGGGNGGGLGRRREGGGPNPAGGRRVPTSPHELLPLLQPTTKALAQVLAGNTKSSGQTAHARNILSQAQRFIDERMVDRLIPAQREEFMEQVARLRLTLADAEAAEWEEAEAVELEPRRPTPVVPLERLRELALSLSTPAAAPVVTAPAPVADQPDDEDEVVPPEEPAAPARVRSDIPEGSPRSARLRLRNEGPARGKMGDGSG